MLLRTFISTMNADGSWSVRGSPIPTFHLPTHMNQRSPLSQRPVKIFFTLAMKSVLFIVGTLALAVRAADYTTCSPVTSTVEATECPLLKCVPAPTVTYSQTLSSTTTLAIPCATPTAGPDSLVKRGHGGHKSCSTVYSTKIPSTCSKCPTTTTETSVIVAIETITTQQGCPAS
ncbi:hypothetical protein M408DRAFT_144132 [Serendipita vermifera MAFF 305830]|uniref:Uncharacterized protein n=1 Tax=Serendipita vermifera MAFF 305830 TaxID=933852 RepID=A0A0C3B9S4_SERVB|nr:hypothetical protein M408DRAFT_144132 [Serendipita vermifera MAFF 305830]